MRYISAITLLIAILWIPLSFAEDQTQEALEEVKALIENLNQLEKEGRYEEAIPYAKKLLEFFERYLEKDDPNMAMFINRFAMLYLNAGRYAEAEPLFKRALEMNEKAFGKDHPDLATSLYNLAVLYRATGRDAEAEAFHKRALEIKERALGKDHPDVATILNDMGLICQDRKKYAEAEEFFERSLKIYEKALGKNHEYVAISLKNLASLCKAMNRYEEAEKLYKRSLEINEEKLGKNHLDLIGVLDELANLCRTIGRFPEAELFYNRSLEIKEKALGKDHPNVAMSLDKLARLYLDTNRYAEAEPLSKRSLEIREKALGKDHPDLAASVNNLALLYSVTGRYAEAECLYKRSLEVVERALGKDDLKIGTGLQNLADLYFKKGCYAEAESLYKRSLEVKEKALGKDHPDIASGLNNLAALYDDTGRYAEAESLYKRSLEVMEKALGKDDPKVAIGLNNLANHYHLTGRHIEAAHLIKRSLEITIKAQGKEHHQVAIGLNTVAELLRIDGRHAEAETLYKKSLEILEKILNRDHPEVATVLSNLALLYRRSSRYAEAEPLCKRSLEIREKALGKDHPDVATSLNNLAELYHRATGRYAEAEVLYKRALEINEGSLGRDHPAVATNLSNLAVLYGTTGNHLESHRMFTRGITIGDKKREHVFLLLSEKQKLNFIEQNNGDIHAFISHAARDMQGDRRAVIDTLDSWLRWKGSVMEAQGRYLDALTRSEDQEIRKRFEELNNIRREIARLQLSGPGKMNPEEYKKRLEELEMQKGALEAELSRLSKEFAFEKMLGKADTKRISEILLKKGNDSVYIDFASIRTYDFKEKKGGEYKYLVFVLLPGSEPAVKLIDLSNTEEINTHIKAYLREMKRAKEFGDLPRERILKAEAKALYELLLKPIEAEIQGKRHLYISPDGNLNLIPFEVLTSPEGKYLLEEYNITYIAAGRDIMRFRDETQAKGEPVIIADPDYDMGLEEKIQVAKAMGVIETRGPAPLSRDAKDLRFGRLPETKQEADVIEKLLKENQKMNVRNYQDKKALEEVLFNVRNPKILHLATHGYFLKDEEVKQQPQMAGFMSLEKERFVDPGIENPMLRSGIVLAGANASLKEGRDDGLVSAEKILGLRLKGTDLVVLSACETGVGDVKSGEGVFGLKRSFILSGAKTVVMSLWSIPSKETTELMTDFYTLMAKGKTKAEALREARLNLMKKKPNPFYWGAFIMVGNPN